MQPTQRFLQSQKAKLTLINLRVRKTNLRFNLLQLLYVACTTTKYATQAQQDFIVTAITIKQLDLINLEKLKQDQQEQKKSVATYQEKVKNVVKLERRLQKIKSNEWKYVKNF